MIHFKTLACLSFIAMFVIPSASAISYIDLERIKVGELETDYGYALDFDGENDYVEVADNATLRLENFTIMMWLKSDIASDTTSRQVIAKPSISGENYVFIWGHTLSSFQQAWGFKDTEAQWRMCKYTTTLVKDTWYHLVATFDSTVLRVYLNGSEDNNLPLAFTPSTSPGNLHISRSNAPFGGVIDEVQIYNRSLNTTEISYSYNNGEGRHEPLNQTGLVAWYHLNEGSGINVYDETENNNDGTLSGDTDEWVTGKVPIGDFYSPYIPITEIEPFYIVKLYNSTNGLVINATVNNEGIANMTIPDNYRISTFEGTYRIYNDNTTFLYQKWFEDIRGGDQYEIISEETSLGLAIIGLVLALFALILALSKFG